MPIRKSGPGQTSPKGRAFTQRFLYENCIEEVYLLIVPNEKTPINFMKFPRYASIACVIVTSAVLSSCQTTGNSKQLYATSAEANNKMMLLNKNVDTFGERRMTALSENYPSVATFLKHKGKPRYFAESMEDDDHMIVFYYPEHRKAYGCRYAIGSTTDMEFVGPFPITDQEMDHLSELENGKSKRFTMNPNDAVVSNRNN